MNPHETFAKVSIRQTGNLTPYPLRLANKCKQPETFFSQVSGCFVLKWTASFQTALNLTHHFTHGLFKTTETLRSALFIYVMWTFLPLNSALTTDSSVATSRVKPNFLSFAAMNLTGFS